MSASKYASVTSGEFSDITTTEPRPASSLGRLWDKYGLFTGLAITTALSVLLLIAGISGWTLSSAAFHFTSNNRATVQSAVQLLSNCLGLIFSSVLCKLINHATRIYLSRNVVHIDTIQFWVDSYFSRIDWGLPPGFLAPLVCFMALVAVQSALWAGANNPHRNHRTDAAQPASRSRTTETPVSSKNGRPKPTAHGPEVRNANGLFTYSFGVQLQNGLLSYDDSFSTSVRKV